MVEQAEGRIEVEGKKEKRKRKGKKKREREGKREIGGGLARELCSWTSVRRGRRKEMADAER